MAGQPFTSAHLTVHMCGGQSKEGPKVLAADSPSLWFKMCDAETSLIIRHIQYKLAMIDVSIPDAVNDPSLLEERISAAKLNDKETRWLLEFTKASEGTEYACYLSTEKVYRELHPRRRKQESPCSRTEPRRATT
jgi:hypothetical protein